LASEEDGWSLSTTVLHESCYIKKKLLRREEKVDVASKNYEMTSNCGRPNYEEKWAVGRLVLSRWGR